MGYDIREYKIRCKSCNKIYYQIQMENREQIKSKDICPYCGKENNISYNTIFTNRVR